jgi:hypothetical protein
MSSSNLFFRILLKPWTHRVAGSLVVGRCRSNRPEDGRFTRAEVKGLVEDAWRIFADLEPHLAAQPTVGSRLNVKLACLTLAFFQALLQRGLERTQAIEIVAELNWIFYAKWGALARFLGGRGITTHFGDLKPGEVVPLLFPFNPPGYIAKWIGGDSEVGYDVVRCPVAEYFRARDAADLCVSSWCNLDFPLGEMLGWKLTREKTLVLGDDRCTFRWKPVAPLAAKPREGQR